MIPPILPQRNATFSNGSHPPTDLAYISVYSMLVFPGCTVYGIGKPRDYKFAKEYKGAGVWEMPGMCSAGVVGFLKKSDMDG